MSNLSFFNEDVDFKLPSDFPYVAWINQIIENNNKLSGDLSFIFSSDKYLLNLNEKYLKHDTLTDIITFDYSHAGIISGDIFISVERVAENALKYNCSLENELHRVMIHGVLHLIGFKDKTDLEKDVMRKQEENALKTLASLVNF